MCCIVLGPGGSQGGPPDGPQSPPGSGGPSGLCYFNSCYRVDAAQW